jgi:hypothetical protein
MKKSVSALVILTALLGYIASAQERMVIKPPASVTCKLDPNQPIYDDGRDMDLKSLSPRKNLVFTKQLGREWFGYMWDHETHRLLFIKVPWPAEVIIDSRNGEPRYLVKMSARLFEKDCVKESK